MVTTNEVEMARDRGLELNEYIIGTYSVAVIVNSSNPVGNLTQDQERDIFTGAVKNWKDVGGPDAPIHLFIRDPISGTYLGFQELAMGTKPYAIGFKTCTNYTAIAQAVAKAEHSIGYSSIELATSPGVKAVSVGGATPTIPSVNKGAYPYSRVLRLYTNRSSEPSAAREFIQFILSTRGQEILTQMGYVPHS
jgi:phosphate transport system substrate-binding protein